MPTYQAPGVYVEEVPPAARPIAGAGTSTAGFIGVVPDTVTLPAPIKGNPGAFTTHTVTVRAPTGRPVLVTSWADFVKNFADLVGAERETAAATVSVNADFRNLAQAVYGFFNNGGTRCYVGRAATNSATDVGRVLDAFAAIDEIAIVAAPGMLDEAVQERIIEHCENLRDRFAVLDGAATVDEFTKPEIQGTTRDSSYAGVYFPWIKVFDPSEKLMTPAGDGSVYVAPSGHVAGVFARVDGERGVYKAPANEVVRGALDVRYMLGKADQEGLNPAGVNVIRSFGGNIKIWGARTAGGDANGDFKYVSTRRFFNFLCESIDEGTQFVVFEPNGPALWQRIVRSVSDFLLNQWRDGALLGETPRQAFFVRCDSETNPPEVREAGRVVCEVGVAIVKPAEFVIFRVQQITGG
jgi:phage tail sheath protein FI